MGCFLETNRNLFWQLCSQIYVMKAAFTNIFLIIFPAVLYFSYLQTLKPSLRKSSPGYPSAFLKTSRVLSLASRWGIIS